MANTKGVGPEGPVQPTGARENRRPSDPKAFREKLEKAGETDPEQKKKRRQQEEEIEELTDKMKQAAKADRTKDTIAPFEIGKKLAASPALNKGAPAPENISAPVAPSPTDEIDTESQFWEEDELGLPQTPNAAEEKAAAAAKRAQGAKEAGLTEKGKKFEAAEVAPLSLDEAKRKRAKEEAKEAAATKAQAPMISAPSSAASEITAPPPPSEVAHYAQLSPKVLALFEKMAGVMTVMTQSGVSETTVSLTSAQFKNSRFFGAEIVIREYSTAPKVFNIEVRGSAEAVAQFQANIPYMKSAFRTGKYNFGIHRLETSIKRIPDEPVSDDEKDKDKEEE